MPDLNQRNARLYRRYGRVIPDLPGDQDISAQRACRCDEIASASRANGRPEDGALPIADIAYQGGVEGFLYESSKVDEFHS